MAKKSKKPFETSFKISRFLLYSGSVLLLLSIFIFISTFYQAIFYEMQYAFFRPSAAAEVKTYKENSEGSSNVIYPVDEDFGLVIPKIGANSKVIKDVDPYNDKDYQWQLTKGVAHAKGTAYPDSDGNVFIFSIHRIPGITRTGIMPFFIF